MKVKEFLNPFIFGLLVGKCCKILKTWIFLETYQIRVIFSQKSYVCDKIEIYMEKCKKLPPKTEEHVFVWKVKFISTHHANHICYKC
jgi:hypothetical protein